MEVKNWDPIEAGVSPEFVSATVKRQIRNILKSYTGWFDPLSEIIQNALDAVEKRKEQDTNYTPIIWIKVDLKENMVCVTDNGIGFTEEEFRSFLAPSVSFKEVDDRGNKGVGATYSGYGFNFLQVGTKTEDFSFVGTIKGGREWVEDMAGIKMRPKVQQSQLIHDAFASIDQGSTFTLRFIGDYIRPKDLKWVGATNVDQWEVVLRLKTPLGGVYFDRKCVLSKCCLTVVDENGLKTEKDITKCEYIFPHTVIPTCKELSEIRRTQQELIEKGRDASKLPDSFYKLNGLYARWSYEDIASDKTEFAGEWTEQEKTLATQHKVSFYGFFGYSTEIWNRYNDDAVGLRKGARILRGGIQLATNCMPQGDLVIIPLTRNIGYQNVTHVVVHFDEADPDLGRKGFQPELLELAQHIGTAVVGRFLIWKRLLKSETGAPPDIIGEKSIHDWIRDQEEHEKENPLVITRQDLFLPMKEPSLTSKPLNEQDVIALFNQLLAGGVIRGVTLMSTSQHQQYDGVYKFRLSRPLVNHVYDKKSNPLGLEKSRVSADWVSAPGILEYKYSFDALLEEIEKEDKSEKQINFVIAWEMGNNWKKRYDIVPLLHLDNIQHRYFHGGTHITKNSSTGDKVFPVVILSELIDYINDPDSVQDYQRQTYIEV